MTRLASRWRSGGLTALKRDLLEIREGKYLPDHKSNWREYRARLESELKPQVSAAIDSMAGRPLISIIMPTYNTPAKLLRKAIASIRRQWYGNWELCISDDGSTDSETLRILTEVSNSDPRIRVRRNRVCLGISANTNMALAMAEGEYLVFMDHDDILMPQALTLMVRPWCVGGSNSRAATPSSFPASWRLIQWRLTPLQISGPAPEDGKNREV